MSGRDGTVEICRAFFVDPMGWLPVSSGLQNRGGSSLDRARSALLDKRAAPVSDRAIAGAILDADRGRCTSTRGLWALSVDTGAPIVQPVTCRTWSCPHCRKLKSVVGYAVLANGMAELQAKGERLRYMTLTDGSSGDDLMTVPEVGAAWSALRQRLRHRGLLREYASSLEMQKRGALHLHVVAAGAYVDQAELSSMAEGVGFGSIVDIRAVQTVAKADHLAAYLTKGVEVGAVEEARTLARYLTKAHAASLRDRGAKSIRPLRLSPSWPGEGLTKGWETLMREWYGEPDRLTSWSVIHESKYVEQLRDVERHRWANRVANERRSLASHADDLGLAA